VNNVDETPGVKHTRDGRVLRIVLDRPGKRNALTADDAERLDRLLSDAEIDKGLRVLVLTATGRTFCSGASLDEMVSGAMSAADFDAVASRLAEVRIPTIARIGGAVYGGGGELALCCDFRIGVRGTRLRVPAARLGLCYPVGGLRRYVERLGLGTATRILLAGEELDDRTMLDTGFLTRLVEPDELDGVVDDLAERISAAAPLAVQGMKRILSQIARGDLDRDEAGRIVATCDASDDLVEGLRAWRERRDPDFVGR